MIDIRDHGGNFGGGARIKGETNFTGVLNGAVAKGDPVISYVDLPLGGERLADAHAYADYLTVNEVDIVETADGVYASLTGTTGSATGYFPFVHFLKIVNDVMVKLPNPVQPVASELAGAAGGRFSPDGNYFAALAPSSNELLLYKRSGDTFTKLANPATLPTFVGNDCAWSLDGKFLAFHTGNNTPYLYVYKRDGDTFTKLADPAVLPAQYLETLVFTAGNNLVCFYSGTGATTSIIMYKVTDTAITSVAGVTDNIGRAQQADISSDGKYLAVSGDSFPGVVYIYGLINDKLVRLEALSINVGTNGSYGCHFTADDRFLLAGAYQVGNGIRIFSIDDFGRFKQIAVPAPLNTDADLMDNAQSSIFSTRSGIYTITSHNSSVRHFSVFKNTVKIKKISNVLDADARRACFIGYADQSGAAAESKKMKVILARGGK